MNNLKSKPSLSVMRQLSTREPPSLGPTPPEASICRYWIHREPGRVEWSRIVGLNCQLELSNLETRVLNSTSSHPLFSFVYFASGVRLSQKIGRKKCHLCESLPNLARKENQLHLKGMKLDLKKMVSFFLVSHSV